MAIQLKELIINEANNTNVSEENKVHHDICVQIKEYAEQNDMPFWLVAIVAVSSSAHKISAFNKGYTSIDLDYANKVFKFTKAIADKFNRPSLRTNVRTALACGRYIRLKGKMNNFKELLGKIEELPVQLNTSKEFLQMLLKDVGTFNKNGNLVSLTKEEPKQEEKKPKTKKEKTEKKKKEEPKQTEIPIAEEETKQEETPTIEVTEIENVETDNVEVTEPTATE